MRMKHQPLALHAALFAVELHGVLFAFCQDKIIVLAASKKAKLLQDLSSKLPDAFKYRVEVLTRDKTDKDKVRLRVAAGWRARSRQDIFAACVRCVLIRPTMAAFAEQFRVGPCRHERRQGNSQGGCAQ